MTAHELANRLNAKPAGDGWQAKCPAHDDSTASLKIDSGEGGKVLIKCFAGCTVVTIVEALGLAMADLFPPKKTRGGRGTSIPPRNAATAQHPSSGCTLTEYAAAKRLPIDKLKTLGLKDISYMGKPALRMPYFDVNRQEVAVRIRRALHKGTDGDDRFVWRRGSQLVPYGLDRLTDIRAFKYVVISEGESDTQTLTCRGIPAIGVPGATSWKEDWAKFFDGIETIYIVIEPDTGGDAMVKWISRSAIRDRVRLVRLDGFKDVSALWIADPDLFMERWVAAMTVAAPWADVEAQQLRTQATTAWASCAALASTPDILAELDRSLTRRGVVGERRAARLVYLSATSRFCARPVSLAVKGPSSGGKSYIVQETLKHFPSSAHYSLSAMSERALAYSEEPLKHRMLVIYEAVGMSGDFTSYLIRSLLSEGCVRYETVEKTKDGIRPRLIEREGPTGLITTTTAVSLHPENETRILSIPVTDTPDHTREILRALSADPRADGEDDLDVWRALQDWVETVEHRVVVPYARRLAEAIPPVAIRLRRDFTALLTLIQSHAILHQVSRERDAVGRIVATLGDYDVVRDLVKDLFDVAVQATVSATIKDTVTAVQALNGPQVKPITLGALAKHLVLDKGTVSRRVKVATTDGYLRNLETRKGQPMQLVCGDPLPDERPLLPEASSLDPCCSVAVLSEGVDTPSPPPVSPNEDSDASYFGA